MVNLNYDTVKRVIVSVDWGYVNPGVMQVWAVDGEGRMFLVHEIYHTKRLMDWWTAQAVAIQKHFKPEAFVCDPAEPAFIQQLRSAGCKAVPANNAVQAGIQAVQQRLARGADDKPRLFLLRGALVERDASLVEAKRPTCTEQEFPGYVWQMTPDGRPDKEEPLKLNDHGMDAARYACLYVDRLPPPENNIPASGGRRTFK